MQEFLDYKGALATLNQDDLRDLFTKLEEYKLKYRTSIDVAEYQSFGTEIEFQGSKLEDVAATIGGNKHFRDWKIKPDDSVTSYKQGKLYGGEVTSPVLHNKKKDWLELQTILKMLKELKCIATSSTAFHIHIGVQIFKDDLKYLIRFIKVWCIFEPIIFRFGYDEYDTPRPYITIFATPIRSLYLRLYNQNHNFFNERSTTKEFDFGKNRAVSFKNYHFISSDEEEFNTIEIRCLNGTLDDITAQNNINFFIKLMEYVTSDKYDAKLIDKLFKQLKEISLEDYSNLDINSALLLGDLIFDNTIDKINYLKQYVKADDYFYLRQLKSKSNNNTTKLLVKY